MKLLTAEQKEFYIDVQVKLLADQIDRNKPKYFSVKELDSEIRQPLIDALARRFILADYDGRRLRLSYVPREDDELDQEM